MIIFKTVFLILLWLGCSVTDASAQDAPVLRFTPPPNTFRQGLASPDDYTFTGFNASVQVYPFRPFTGDIQQAFQTTLLRDWISPLNQERSVAGQPNFATVNIPGAQLAMVASFTESLVGLPKPHLRLVIVAGNQAAIVDASAPTMESWQAAASALEALGDSLRVEVARAAPPLSQAAGHGIAGLYLGMKAKYMAPPLMGMSSRYQVARHYYLFSADGRVYRAYDRLDVPDGNPAHFNFDAAESRDPENTGRYTVDGGRLIIQLGGASPQTMATTVPHDGTVAINGVIYTRM